MYLCTITNYDCGKEKSFMISEITIYIYMSHGMSCGDQYDVLFLNMQLHDSRSLSSLIFF